MDLSILMQAGSSLVGMAETHVRQLVVICGITTLSTAGFRNNPKPKHCQDPYMEYPSRTVFTIQARSHTVLKPEPNVQQFFP